MRLGLTQGYEKRYIAGGAIEQKTGKNQIGAEDSITFGSVKKCLNI